MLAWPDLVRRAVVGKPQQRVGQRVDMLSHCLRDLADLRRVDMKMRDELRAGYELVGYASQPFTSALHSSTSQLGAGVVYRRLRWSPTTARIAAVVLPAPIGRSRTAPVAGGVLRRRA